MTDTLTQIISKVQASLGDNGTLFTTTTITAATRQALSEWNLRAPQHLATLIDGVTDQYEYELTDADAASCKIMDILRQGDNADERDVSLDYDDYIEDERIFFRLRVPVTSTDVLIARYTAQHTISGLDSATESTIPTYYDQAIVQGAAYYSILIRATGRVESNNLSRAVPDDYRELAMVYAQSFASQLTYAARYRKPPVSQPDTRAWNDEWH